MRKLVLVLSMCVSSVSFGTEAEKKKNKVTVTSASVVQTNAYYTSSTELTTVAYERKVNPILSLGVSIGSGSNTFDSTSGYLKSGVGSFSVQVGLNW